MSEKRKDWGNKDAILANRLLFVGLVMGVILAVAFMLFSQS